MNTAELTRTKTGAGQANNEKVEIKKASDRQEIIAVVTELQSNNNQLTHSV